MYTIEINYTTGDSFGSSEEVDTVGCVWEDLEQARVALSYIKDHYEHYKQVNGWDEKVKEKDMRKIVKTKPWIAKELDHWQYRMSLPCGETTQNVSAFWCGYFEILHSARIIGIEDSRDSFHV